MGAGWTSLGKAAACPDELHSAPLTGLPDISSEVQEYCRWGMRARVPCGTLQLSVPVPHPFCGAVTVVALENRWLIRGAVPSSVFLTMVEASWGGWLWYLAISRGGQESPRVHGTGAWAVGGMKKPTANAEGVVGL